MNFLQWVAAVSIFIVMICTLVVGFALNWIAGIAVVAIWAYAVAVASRQLIKEEEEQISTIAVGNCREPKNQ
jgi:Na+/H+ antiporter NhaC